MLEISGHLLASGLRLGLVAARFNERVVDRLLSGALDILVRHGAKEDDLVVVRVPGAWEIPLALDELARTGRFSALVALGAVIRGDTPHFDVVVDGCTRGVQAVSERHRIPVGLGVLTCENSAQAEERAGGKLGNKGAEAALAALEMADLLARIRA